MKIPHINIRIVPHSFKGKKKNKINKEHVETYQDAKGNIWELYFDKQGRIKYSYKNGACFKVFNYNNPETSDVITDFGYHIFSDGTKISNRGFFSIHNVDVEKYNTSTALGNGAFILRNKAPKHLGEPICAIRRYYNDGTEIVQTHFLTKGEEKTEFQTLEDASSFFKDEYGIDAKFFNIELAYITKEVIEDFIKLESNEKEKKMFEGLKIDYKEYDDSLMPANLERKTLFPQSFCKLDVKSDEFFDAIDKSSDDEYEFEHATLFLNKNYPWDKLEENACNEFESGFHSSDSAKHVLIHELGHYLHAKTSPKFEFKSYFKKIDLCDLKTLNEVSRYASCSYGEFVAEYIAGRMAGYLYSKDADDIYQQYGGPKLFD